MEGDNIEALVANDKNPGIEGAAPTYEQGIMLGAYRQWKARLPWGELETIRKDEAETRQKIIANNPTFSEGMIDNKMWRIELSHAIYKYDYIMGFKRLCRRGKKCLHGETIENDNGEIPKGFKGKMLDYMVNNGGVLYTSKDVTPTYTTTYCAECCAALEYAVNTNKERKAAYKVAMKKYTRARDAATSYEERQRLEVPAEVVLLEVPL